MKIWREQIFHTFIMIEQRGLHRGGGKKGQLTGLFGGKDTLKPEIENSEIDVWYFPSYLEEVLKPIISVIGRSNPQSFPHILDEA